jgi:recombination protein RecA
MPELWYLPTSSFGINRALGGRGLASGRIHVYWGPKASGKTTLALQQIALAQQQGKVCGYINSERAYNDVWAAANGVDVEALKRTDTVVVEDALSLVMPDMAEGNIDLLVVDSVNSLNYRSFFDDPESQGMGTYARSSKMFAHKLLSVLGPTQQVILISQQSMQKSGQQFVAGATVGSAIEHWASTMIKFRKTGSRQPDRNKDGTLKPDPNKEWRTDGSFKVHWQLQKSKQSPYPVSGSYYFNADSTIIDQVDEVVDIAKELEIVTGSTWLEFKEQKFQGKAKLGEYLRENPRDLKLLQDTINQYEIVAEGEIEDE